jgi:hypothetical protein
MNELSPYRVMLALSESANLQAWVNLARLLVVDPGEIHLRGMITLPEGKSLSEGVRQAQQWRETINQLALDDPLVDDTTSVHVDYRPMARVLEETRQLEIDLLLVMWESPEAGAGGVGTNDILQLAACDVVLFNAATWEQNVPVLLSLRGGPNISLGVRFAKALAGSGSITLFHAADRARAAPDLKILMRTDPQITRSITAMTDIVDGILQEAPDHKAIILGATFQQPDPQTSRANPVVQRIYTQARLPLALVRSWEPEAMEYHIPGVLGLANESLSTRVDRWFAENTFDSSEFGDLRALMALKEKRGWTISVGLPALNEEETVGTVIDTLKRELMDKVPLVDEIVLIDSNSADDTVAIAESYGIPVYKHPEILPEMGTYAGKGEALWKSLHVLNGDIIAWVDTDITNIHPRFIYGLIGPLLKRPQVQYVKGFYSRPIRVNDKMQASGGGRVTELVARPLLNLFYPELSGILQPLSGEYAGRRTALEQVPFFSGYGVETGLLIDLHERYGLEGIAQTNLETRVHHNQPLVGLSKMSFAILQVFIARIESRYGVELLEKANRSMKLIVQEPERFALDIAEITDLERPSMVTVPGYLERFKQRV